MEWNQLLRRLGYKVREGETVDDDFTFKNFDAVIEEELAKVEKMEAA